ncbi:MAG: LacI family DNA-binding transcriptional regulator [Anaerolineae bacterium]|nr:LacI family DNA-binding transcriptional regulator [Anaerolineae bacterium]
MKRLTLDEIGHLAGVSRATVSRVINNYPHITPEVRERVQKVITQTGYQPNVIARSLASNRSTIIGLVIPSDALTIFTDPYFPSLIQGITQSTNQLNLTLSLFLFHSMEEEIRTARSILNTGLLDGVIITADRREDSFVSSVLKHGLPFVVIGRPELVGDIPFVNVDNVSGAQLATEHLIAHGRRRVATIRSVSNTAGEDRFIGFQNALRNHSIKLDPRLVAYGDFSLESGYVAMQQLLPAKPDAVFIASDTMALGAQRAIREAGLRIPDDVAIVGFDDLPPSVHAEPQLTTVRQPVRQMGSTAVELLNNIVNGIHDSPAQIILPVELIVRASCGSEHTN